jgi:hypothetical protein
MAEWGYSQQSSFCDFALVVDGQKFYLPRQILAMYGDLFYKVCFDRSCDEALSGKWILVSITEREVLDLLDYIVTPGNGELTRKVP